MRPVELFGQTTFPLIGDLPYLLTLGPYAFYWLALAHSPADAATAEQPALPSLAAPARVGLALRSRPPPTLRRGAAAPPAQPALVRRQGPARHRGADRRRGRAAAAVPLERRRGARRAAPGAHHVRRGRLPRRRARDVRAADRVRPRRRGRAVHRGPPRCRARARPADRRAKRACSSTRTGCPATAARSWRRCAPSPAIRTELGSIVGVPNARSLRALAAAATQDIPVNVLRGEQSNTSIAVRRAVHAEDDAARRNGARTPRSRSGARSPTGPTSRTRPRSRGRSSTAPASTRARPRRSR